MDHLNQLLACVIVHWLTLLRHTCEQSAGAELLHACHPHLNTWRHVDVNVVKHVLSSGCLRLLTELLRNIEVGMLL